MKYTVFLIINLLSISLVASDGEPVLPSVILNNMSDTDFDDDCTITVSPTSASPLTSLSSSLKTIDDPDFSSPATAGIHIWLDFYQKAVKDQKQIIQNLVSEKEMILEQNKRLEQENDLLKKQFAECAKLSETLQGQ